MIIYGGEDHPEVRGVPAWTQGQGIAILYPEEKIEIPRRSVALLPQTAKGEGSFADFVARLALASSLASRSCASLSPLLGRPRRRMPE